ncbi:helix-turn-helix domain-containing protein [Paenibacillus aurantiacus]|uniref:Helix-turn-helix domain-containing protein n=1 Tax=Paenibacillus aurantiacus TaxID=1936118 RepID=A0ABV5L1M3_9BACL
MEDIDNIESFFTSAIKEINYYFECMDDKSSGSAAIDARLIKINRFIRQYYSSPLTLDTLASLVQCNPVYLSNTYSKVFGISVMQYLQAYRMKKAKELLANTKVPIRGITTSLGYFTNSQFGAIFKKHFDITPGDYRKKHAIISKTPPYPPGANHG